MTDQNKSPPAHTAGPWEYDGDGFDSAAAQDFGTDGYIVFPRDKDGDPDAPVCEISDRLDDAEAEANARLIAAAPCLLEALEDFMRDGSQAYRERISKKARAAIAKAKGGAA
jgi:hypothetical protein